MSFAKVCLIGNLGKDPEIRYTTDGTAVCSFSMATSEKKKDKAGDYQEITTWWKVTLWRKQAENASKYLTKGKKVYIEGRPSLSVWIDRDGKERTTLEVNASEMQFLDSKNSGDRSDNSDHDQRRNYKGDSDHDQKQQPAAPPAKSSTEGLPIDGVEDDDVPF